MGTLHLLRGKCSTHKVVNDSYDKSMFNEGDLICKYDSNNIYLNKYILVDD